MLFNLGKTISLSNLKRPRITKKRAKRNNHIFGAAGSMCKKGQIATLFILMIIFILIFTLVVINIGDISGRLTQISNAVDSGGLFLGSQLSTKSHMLYEALGNKTKVCKRGGLLPIIIAVIVAAVLTYLFPQLAWYWVVLASAIAGAIGGLIVYRSAKGAMLGAIQGAMVGAAVQGGAHLGSKLFAKEAVVEGAMSEVPEEALLTEPGVSAAAPSAMDPLSLGVSGMATVPSTAGAIVGASLAGAASIYTGAMNDKSLEAGLAHFAKALSGLPEYEGVREGIFLYVFSGAVDDPNKVTDTNDIDCDGKTDDEVPAFSVWWDEHIKDLKASLGSGVDVIADFLNNSLEPFKSGVEGFVPDIDRKEVECDCSSKEGPDIELWRALEDCNYEVSFWEPGPDKASLVEWYKKDCEDCPAPSGYDYVDGARYHMEEFIDYAEGILEQDAGDLDRNYDWIDLLHNTKDSDGSDFYGDLGRIASAIGDWIDETIELRDELPGCQLEYIEDPRTIMERMGHEPLCNEYNPPDELIYPCNWDKYKLELSGIILPNPVCKLYAEDKTILRNEIDTVREFVVNLEDHIRETDELFLNPCPGENCSLVGEIEIEVLEICLDGDIHSPCDRTGLGVGEATITYKFHYKYTCECCHEECEGEGEDEECHTECEQTTYEGDKEKAEQLPTPDLQIPCMVKGAFLGVLDEMEAALDSVDDEFATIDIRWDDEFKPVLNSLEAEQAEIDGFLPKVEKFHDDIQNIIDTSDRAEDGAGKLTYEWDDRRGGTPEHHSVTVETGPFKFARLKKKKHGGLLINKTCIELKDYRDDGSRTWIKVNREDPATDKDVGILGKWNPGGKSSKECHVYYSYDKVGIKSVK